MQSLYSESTLDTLNGQIRRRFLLVGVIAAVLLGLGVWLFVMRNRWVSAALFFACGAVLVFGIDHCCMPLIRYRRLVTSALHGRTHNEDFVFSRTESDLSLVDGVSCRGIIVLGNADKHGSREQRFYWDAEFPVPAFQEGQSLSLTYTGRFIIAYAQ